MGSPMLTFSLQILCAFAGVLLTLVNGARLVKGMDISAANFVIQAAAIVGYLALKGWL
jgi:hypothetical protein